ncbi:MCE family protein [Rhodococcus gannanensis]|uniref:MCE family protein n=1 Tax=Rhodococcus gannanensis TaxID=1960308 RepID=A0ABW4P4W3_9NOCA
MTADDAQRRLLRRGIVGVAVAIAVVLTGLQYADLQFLKAGVGYRAVFADAGGLLPGDDVEIAGITSGSVDDIEVDGDRVVVSFTLDADASPGDRTTAAIKTHTILGRKSLAVVPDGASRMPVGGTIPLDRTTSPYSLTDALGDLTGTVHDLDTDALNSALDAMSGALTDTPVPLGEAASGITALTEVLNARDTELLELLKKARSVTTVLAERGDQINALLLDGNDLLGELERRRDAITELVANVSAVSRQLTGLVADNEAQLAPVLTKLDAVTALLVRNRDSIAGAVEGLGPYATSLGEAVGSGPYFQAYVQNYAAGEFLSPLMSALVNPGQLPKDLQALMDPPPSVEFKDTVNPR